MLCFVIIICMGQEDSQLPVILVVAPFRASASRVEGAPDANDVSQVKGMSLVSLVTLVRLVQRVSLSVVSWHDVPEFHALLNGGRA